PFRPSVSSVDKITSRGEPGSKFLDYGPDQVAVRARTESNPLPSCDGNRDSALLAVPGIPGIERIPFREVARQRAVPGTVAEGLEQSQGTGRSLIDRMGTIHRPIGLIRIVLGNSRITE